ncbi:MAG: helix-turn-helix domain-containing protein [Actinomycetota bacterium]
MSTSQTLDRGLTALALIAAAGEPPTIDGVAADLGVHRSVAYRIIRTLEDHHLVRRDEDGRCHPGVGLAVLARSARTAVQAAAIDELAALANRVRLTSFLVLRDGSEAVTVESIEPAGSLVGVSYKPGTRHPVDRGAPGIALLAAGPPAVGERPEVDEARRRGWASSRAEVIPGMASVAAPLVGHEASVAVISLAADDRDEAELATAVMAAAASIADRLGTRPAATAR